LRKIFGPERKEYRSWRKLHNDDLHSLYSLHNILRVIKSRRMRWWDMWHAWERCVQGFGWKGRDHSEDIGIAGRLTLRWTLGR